MSSVVPQIAIVRACSDAGPYRRSDLLSLAFTTPLRGRLVPHDTRDTLVEPDGQSAPFPESFEAEVIREAEPYERGAFVTLSFVDPRFVTIRSAAGHVPGDRPSLVARAPQSDPAADAYGADARRQTSTEAALAVASAVAERPTDDSSDVADDDPADGVRAATSGPADRWSDPSRSPRSTHQREAVDDAMVFRWSAVAATAFASADPARIEASEAAQRRDTTAPGDEARHAEPRESGVLSSHESVGALPALDGDTSRRVPDEADGMLPAHAELPVRLDDDGAHRSRTTRGSPPPLAWRDDEQRGDVPTAALRPDATGVATPEVAASALTVRSLWSAERTARFVQLVDKLFTADRLGWFRHALVVRMLLPESVACTDSSGEALAQRELDTLRAASTVVLGRPLLAAFMPNFAVTAEWLASLESPAEARAIGALRDVIAQYGSTEDDEPQAEAERVAVGRLHRHSLERLSSGSIEAVLPLLVPHVTSSDAVSAKLGAYRSSMVDLFGQMANATEVVRLRTMTQPSHLLDDRLWQLVGALGTSFSAPTSS